MLLLYKPQTAWISSASGAWESFSFNVKIYNKNQNFERTDAEHIIHFSVTRQLCKARYSYVHREILVYLNFRFLTWYGNWIKIISVLNTL